MAVQRALGLDRRAAARAVAAPVAAEPAEALARTPGLAVS